MTDDAVSALTTLVEATLADEPVNPAGVAGALATLGVHGDAAARLTDQVHRAHRERSRLRRREHELATLFASAHELAQLRDSDALLARLVQRAHEMLGGDVTYLSEFDPSTRELRVRETSGSVSAAFQRLRVPPGRGLASVIVESRTAQWAQRYAEYQQERHDRAIDDAVTGEGIVSILGVPMLTDDEVLGVLFVATREEHSFPPEEIALLSALADHASIVLQTVRTLRDLRRSEDETRQALGRLTEHLVERDRASQVHQELVQAVLAGGGFGPVARTLTSALGRAVAIVDVDGQQLATPERPLPAGMTELSEQTRTAIEQSRRSGHCVAVEDSPDVRAVAALTAGTQCFGAILLGGGEFDLGAVDRRTVERAAQVGALIAVQQEAVAGAEHRTQSELLADLLDAVPERRTEVERRLRRRGTDLGHLDSLILLVVPGEARTAAARALTPEFDRRALVGEYRGFVVACYDSATVRSTPEELRETVSRTVRHPVVAIHPPPSTGRLPAAARQAIRTARLVAALGADDLTACTDDYLPYSAVLDTDGRSLTAFVESTIGAVHEYDREHGTDLVGTLRAFVRHQGSPTSTARALHFHTNTILQRLTRLDSVLGQGWREDERLFRIGMAARLDELAERLRTPRKEG